MWPMMTARIGKGFALLGFLLPWLVVSCDGKTIMSASGLQLVTGHVTAIDDSIGGNNHAWLLLLAVLVIGGGLAATWATITEKAKAQVLIGTSAVALALCLLTFAQVGGAFKGKASSDGMEKALIAAIKVEPRIGFFVTLLGLLTAGGMGVILVMNKQDLVLAELQKMTQGMKGISVNVASGAGAGAGDERYWDGLANKNDPDTLEEYLIRFPGGRFAELARARMERAGRAPPVAPPPPEPLPTEPQPVGASVAASAAASTPLAQASTAPPAAARSHCGACGARLAADARFCGECGAAVT